MNNQNWDELTRDATKISKSWSNHSVAVFHYFNQNGLYAKWRGNCDRISNLSKNGEVPKGFVLAYGYGSSHCVKQLGKLIKLRRVSSYKLRSVLGLLQKHINTQNKIIGDQND